MSIYPKTVEEYHKQAVKFLKAGNFQEAENLYKYVLEVDPDFISAYNNLGIILRVKGDLPGAKQCYLQAINLNPQYFQGYSNLGNVLKIEGKLAEAERAYRQALELQPEFADAHNNLGGVLQLQGKLAEAVQSYETAIRIRPDYTEAYGNLGGALLLMGKVEQAEVCLRVVEKTDAITEPLYNLANLIKEREEDLPEAVRLYQRVIKKEEDNSDALNGLLGCLKQLGNWSEADRISARLDTLTRQELRKGGRSGETPYTAISRSDDPRRNLQIAQSWSNHIKKKVSAQQNLRFYYDRSKKGHAKLRIGYLSRDFIDHPVGHLIKGLFARHDRRKFTVYCFSFGGSSKDRFKTKIERGCDYFVDLTFMSFADAAQRIHAEEIDILVDLMGHTNGTRLEIMAFRPSPVQVSYLGFPGSIGADFIDYQIVDRVVVPKGQEKYYDEKLIFMPDCYQINDSKQKISPENFKRADFNLPDDAFVFCSFNRLFKITPQIFAGWMTILKAVPGSVLWLSKPHPEAEKRLRREAKKKKINPKRLIFSGIIPLEEHLKRLTLADLMLDTAIYSGGATTSHAIRMGIPVITFPSKTYLSRMSASLLKSVGMDELVVGDLDEYKKLAIELGKDRKRLRELKNKLRKNSHRTKLFDTKNFVQNLELIYKKVFEVYQNGEVSRSLDEESITSERLK